MGQTSEALLAYHQMLSGSQTALELYLPLVKRLTKAGTLNRSEWGDLLTHMEILFNHMNLSYASIQYPSSDKSRFLDAMARAAEKAGDLPAVWRYQTLSNTVQLRRYSREPDQHNSDIHNKQGELPYGTDFFWPIPIAALSTQRDFKVPPIQPIFIVGLPNSGIEALTMILDSQKDIVGMPARVEYFAHLSLVSDHSFRHGAYDLYRRIAMNTAIKIVSSGGDYRYHKQLIEEFRDSIGETYDVLVRHAVGSGVKAGSPSLRDIRFILDYSPRNFAYLREPLSLFPHSLCIHVIRDDPMDAILMNYRHPQFGDVGVNVGGSLWAYDLDSSKDRMIEYKMYMNHWTELCALQYGDVSDNPNCPRILEIKYSDIKRSPAQVLRRVLDALGIDSDHPDRELSASIIDAVSASDGIDVKYATGGLWKAYDQDELRRINSMLKIYKN